MLDPKIKAELMHFAFEPKDDPYYDWAHSPDIRVAALAALVEIEKLESLNAEPDKKYDVTKDPLVCWCPDMDGPHYHDNGPVKCKHGECSR